jgi:hypothetical protein
MKMTENNQEYTPPASDRQLYINEATSVSPALIIFLLDISGSMGQKMPDGYTRIETVETALHWIVKQMVKLALENGVILPRYRIGMIGYSDDVFDILGGIQTIDVVAKKGIPKLQRMNQTDPARGFRYARRLVKEEISSWDNDAMTVNPAPLIIHLTDAEFTEKFEAPEEIVKDIKNIVVPDGPVLVENIYISNRLNTQSIDPQKWPGYLHGTDLGDEYANRLLMMSSRIPDAYREGMIDDHKLNIQEGAALMFPGNLKEFIQYGFVVATGSSGVKARLGKTSPPPKKNQEWETDQ